MTKRRVLFYGQSNLLSRLSQILRASAQLEVEEDKFCSELNRCSAPLPDVIVVDAAQVTPEQFQVLLERPLASQTTLISVDPCTYQLTVLSSPRPVSKLAHVVRIIEILSLSLSQPA